FLCRRNVRLPGGGVSDAGSASGGRSAIDRLVAAQGAGQWLLGRTVGNDRARRRGDRRSTALDRVSRSGVAAGRSFDRGGFLIAGGDVAAAIPRGRARRGADRGRGGLGLGRGAVSVPRPARSLDSALQGGGSRAVD